MPSFLFPVPPSRIHAGFTTSPVIRIQNVARVELSDSALGVHKVWSQTAHKVVITSEGKQAWEAYFPAGSINPGNKQSPPGGFGFYLRGPKVFHDIVREQAPEEVLMGYEVMFEHGWEWRKGGKLPGIYGGVGEAAYGCTGGRQTDRCRCFNLRLMWRENGLGELYTYLPQNQANTEAMIAVPPRSIQHPDFGFSVGRGAWSFVPGKWTTVAERVKMNTVGKADGEVELFIDGRSVLHATGLILRDPEAPNSSVQGLHFQTFFGGHSPDWASPRNQRVWFSGVSGAVLKPRGHVAGEL